MERFICVCVCQISMLWYLRPVSHEVLSWVNFYIGGSMLYSAIVIIYEYESSLLFDIRQTRSARWWPGGSSAILKFSSPVVICYCFDLHVVTGSRFTCVFKPLPLLWINWSPTCDTGLKSLLEEQCRLTSRKKHEKICAFPAIGYCYRHVKCAVNLDYVPRLRM